MRRGGFTFIEILISVLIITIASTAIFKFNMFIKNKTEKELLLKETMALSSPFFTTVKLDKTREYSVFDFVVFGNLSDEERKVLKDTKIKISYEEKPTIELYNEGDVDVRLNHYFQYIKKDEQLKFVRIDNQNNKK